MGGAAALFNIAALAPLAHLVYKRDTNVHHLSPELLAETGVADDHHARGVGIIRELMEYVHYKSDLSRRLAIPAAIPSLHLKPLIHFYYRIQIMEDNRRILNDFEETRHTSLCQVIGKQNV